MDGLKSMRAENWNINNAETTNDNTIFKIESSHINMIQNVTISTISQEPLSLRYTDIEMIEQLNIDS